MFVFYRPIIGCGIVAAFLWSIGQPHSLPYYIAGILLIIAAVMSLYTAYFWWSFAPPSIMFFGTMVVVYSALAYMSF